MAIVILATAGALALRLYEVLRPGYLLGVTGYDDGVDFGSALRLVHGVMPYRDFALVQPPGITLLMSPIAFLADATSTDTGLAVARILTVCAGAAGVALTGLIVRHRGSLATALACAIVAVDPDAILAAHSVLLEPWLMLFCLAGALLVFDGDRLSTSGTRLWLGGIAFGFGGAIKVWAIFPVLIIVVLCRPWRGWRRVSAFAGGVLAGFCIPVLPFAAAAPRSFFDDVIAAQLTRLDVTRVPVADRFISMTGIRDLMPSRTVVLLATVAISGFIAACLVSASMAERRWPSALELFALATTAVVLIAFLWPADYYPHYAGFFAPWLALSIVLPASRSVASARTWRFPGAWRHERTRSLGRSLTVLAGVVFAALAVVQFKHEAGLAGADPAGAEHQIPPGACVLTDMASYTIAADRFISNDARCPQIVDSIGTDYALAGGRNALVGAGRVQAVQTAWLSAFARAQYIWLNCAPPGAFACDTSTGRRIPWTPAIRRYFFRNFRPVPGAVPYVYVRSALTTASP